MHHVSARWALIFCCAMSAACGDRRESGDAAGRTEAATQPSAPPKLDAALTPAFRAIKSHRYEEARQLIDAYRATPGQAHPGQAEFLTALSYHEQQLYQSARPHFARALELEPDYFTTQFFFGFTLFNLGQLDEAKQALERFHEHSPDDAETEFGLGLVALEQDRADDSEQHILRAIAIAERKSAGGEPSAAVREDLARYQARLGDVYLRRDDLARARAALETSVALWPDHFEPWHKLARVRQRLGDAAGAQEAQARSDAALARRTGKGEAGR